MEDKNQQAHIPAYGGSVRLETDEMHQMSGFCLTIVSIG